MLLYVAIRDAQLQDQNNAVTEDKLAVNRQLEASIEIADRPS